MKAPQREGGSDFEKHPAGACALVCTRVIDKGTVFNEQKQKEQRKISIFFESEKLMSEGDFAGKPFIVVANFNYSMYQNAMLCKFIEAWRGKAFADQDEADAFDLTKLLRQPCFANIVHDGQWVNVTSPMPMPEGMKAPEPQGDVYAFDMEEIDMAVYEKLSDRMKANIQKAKEWQERGKKPEPEQPSREPGADDEPFDDDLPFD